MMKAEKITKAVKGAFYGKDEGEELVDLHFDSRLVSKGSAYFSFPGLHHHGDEFIPKAIENGASLVVTNKRHLHLEDKALFFICDQNIRSVYAKACRLFFDCPDEKIKVIGLSGTDGKTTTGYFIYQLFNELKHKAALLSTTLFDDGSGLIMSPFHNTTPEAFDVNRSLAEAVRNGCEYFILEATSHALSEEYDRLSGISFSSSLYTTVSSEHLEFHKTLAAYYAAKLNLAKQTKGPVFVFEDNRLAEELKEIKEQDLIILKHPEIKAINSDGLIYTYNGREAALPFCEDFVLDNAILSANLVCKELNLPFEEVSRHFSTLKRPPGRQERIRDKRRKIEIVIDFAHTPDAFEHLFSAYRKIYPSSRFISLFGASGNRDKSKRAPMGEVAARYCEKIILSEDDPREEDPKDICFQIAQGIEDKSKVIIETDRRKAIRTALGLASENDILFLLGLGAQTGLDYYTFTKDWDEKTECLRALREIKE